MDAGKVFGILALLAMAGMIIVPIIPYIKLRVDKFENKKQKKKPPYELL